MHKSFELTNIFIGEKLVETDLGYASAIKFTKTKSSADISFNCLLELLKEATNVDV